MDWQKREFIALAPTTHGWTVSSMVVPGQNERCLLCRKILAVPSEFHERVDHSLTLENVSHGMGLAPSAASSGDVTRRCWSQSVWP